MMRDAVRIWMRAGAVAIAVGVAAVPCHAQNPDPAAAQLFRAGTAAYERGEYQAAAIAFEEAHRREPHGAGMYNAGLAWETAKQPDRAAADFAAALTFGDLDEQQRKDAQSRLSTLERTVARIVVRAPAACRISVSYADHVPPGTVYVMPGSHRVTAWFPDGTTGSSEVQLQAAGLATVNFVPAPEPVRSAPRIATPAAKPSAEPPTARTNSQPLVGWVTLGASVALVATGAVLGVTGLHARDRFDDSNHFDAEAHDQAIRMRTWANVCFGVGGVAAATGVTLLLTTPSRSAAPAMSAVQLGPGQVRWVTRF